MVHLITHNILAEASDPMRVRAGELLFREQTVSTENGRLMLADSEVVEIRAHAQGAEGGGTLLGASGLAALGLPLQDVSLDMLDDDNKDLYWERSDRFDTAVDFRFTQLALDAFARVLEAWIFHFHRLRVRIQPQLSIRDRHWTWHVGLDAQATRLLNALYEGRRRSPAISTASWRSSASISRMVRR
ncbi:DUF6352 family protein [Breoghania sp.]|uniref:DUF6352 family protein n=1 Tax=Breoghania sp. TaxID=2065378 RepID=UPI0026393F7D|nr:DUF6352 family protein [Breoghania sp.]MDJ0931416.1 DUF6352 family protein [Breoghania sp.]